MNSISTIPPNNSGFKYKLDNFIVLNYLLSFEVDVVIDYYTIRSI